MDCKDFERLIPDFISDELDDRNMKAFCRHMNECKDCREELEIQFLVKEGIQRLEDGRAFSLQKELDMHLANAEKRVRFHDTFMRIGLALEIGAACVLAGFIIWILL